MMRSVHLSEVFAKLASIKLTPRQLFTYVPLPDDLVSKLKRIQEKLPLEAPEELDHITLMHIPKAAEDVPPRDIDRLVAALRKVAEETPSIHAKVQGWAYFDGAKNHDDETATALVALVDAPGLEDLHVELKAAARGEGFLPSSTHVFTPHFTFAYLKQGGRVLDLPMIDGEFDIDRARFANADIHELPLKGRLGAKAAQAAIEVAKGMEVEQEHQEGAKKTHQIVLDHLRERPDYYSKLEQCMPEKKASALSAEMAVAQHNEKNSAYGGKGPFTLPKDHVAAMRVAKGGSCCANCEYVDAKKHECTEEHYIKWNGGDPALPDLPHDQICSDWWSPK